jgi:ASC-1-like (ASCH) protein
MQKEIPIMTFEDELYGAMCNAHPALTVRAFSHALGMSSGYWSSITAQQLPVSNAALINLSDHIEFRKVLAESESTQLKRLNDIQRMIAKEIVNRFALENESFEEVWDEVSTSLRQCRATDNSSYGAMPFVMSSY